MTGVLWVWTGLKGVWFGSGLSNKGLGPVLVGLGDDVLMDWISYVFLRFRSSNICKDQCCIHRDQFCNFPKVSSKGIFGFGEFLEDHF